jgi:hypothetical protein
VEIGTVIAIKPTGTLVDRHTQRDILTQNFLHRSSNQRKITMKSLRDPAMVSSHGEFQFKDNHIQHFTKVDF